MHWKSFGRTAALTGAVTLMLAFAPVLAATETPNTPPVRPDKSCASAKAATLPIAIIDKIGERDFQCLGVSLENGAIKTILLETHSFADIGKQPEQERTRLEEFPQAVIDSLRGAVLDGIPGHDAIILRGRFITPSHKLELVASFLYNGFTNEYHSCRITLEKTPNRNWRLVDRLDQTITHIAVRTRQMPLIGAFGIANLDGACIQDDAQ
jgi:hypothetical protein